MVALSKFIITGDGNARLNGSLKAIREASEASDARLNASLKAIREASDASDAKLKVSLESPFKSPPPPKFAAPAAGPHASGGSTLGSKSRRPSR